MAKADMGAALAAEVDELRAERDKLQRFKDWVHAYLDAHGVPHHPPGVHGSEGCRIGDRMDWVFTRLRTMETALQKAADEDYRRLCTTLGVPLTPKEVPDVR